MNPTQYHISTHQIPAEKLREWGKLSPTKSYMGLASVWASIFALVYGFRYLAPPHLQPWLWLPIGFLIAGRQGALLQLAHEAAHQLLSTSRIWNDRLASWLCAIPLGFSHDGYARTHLAHHAGVGTENDPPSDSEKYRIVDTGSPKLYLLFLKDLCGWSAARVFFSYSSTANEKTGFMKRAASLAGAQLLLLAILFQGDLLAYLLLWAVPAACFHMFLMRIRGIAEHGLAKQIGAQPRNAHEGGYYTRSFLTKQNSYSIFPVSWIEKALIGSFNVYFHHEHHLVPFVPFYNLPLVHEAVAERALTLNPNVYAKGYLAAALRKPTRSNPPAEESLRRPA